MSRPFSLLLLALVAAALYLYALASGNAVLALLAKPVPVLALILWLRTTPATTYRRWIMIGLGFSVLGDILLAIPADLFVFGLGAFLFATWPTCAATTAKTARAPCPPCCSPRSLAAACSTCSPATALAPCCYRWRCTPW